MDKKEDVEIEYWCNGNKRSKVHYNYNGKKEGLRTDWYESGAKKSECKYSTGRITGIANTWYESGQMEFEIPFKVGARHGVEIKWFESGKIESEDYYWKGISKGKLRLNYTSKE
jgi:antitoxin component YwqK of YwqJK toxin-antitoxin module